MLCVTSIISTIILWKHDAIFISTIILWKHHAIILICFKSDVNVEYDGMVKGWIYCLKSYFKSVYELIVCIVLIIKIFVEGWVYHEKSSSREPVCHHP